MADQANSHEAKILSQEALLAVRQTYRRDRRTVVQCHGCFDIVHPGHIRYLRHARSLGDVLVVTLTGDQFIDKGHDRPYIPQDLRAENLAALEFVDHVHINPNPTAEALLEVLRPDVYVKGKEYESSEDARFAREKQLVESHGGQVVYSSGDVVFSSTRLISQIGRDSELEHARLRFYCQTHEITRRGLLDRLARLTDQRALVLGDPILDVYVDCEDTSIASESPMISVTPLQERSYAGAAALIATQLAALGARATLLTTARAGEDTARFEALVRRYDVEIERLPSQTRPVYIKRRFLVDDKKLFKLNEGVATPPTSSESEALAQRLEALVAEHEVVVVTDFGYGLFGGRLIERIRQLCERTQTPYVVDVSRAGISNLLKFRGARLATPTEDELRFAMGDLESGLSHLASRFYEETDDELLVLTLGRRGCILFTRDEEAHKLGRLRTDYLPAFEPYARDVVGAGDAFLAAFLASDLAGGAPAQSMYLASALAALHIHTPGNEPTALPRLERYLRERPELDDDDEDEDDEERHT